MDHYRNCKFFVPKTGAYRTSGSFELFPQHCIIPDFTPTQHAEAVQEELIKALKRIPKNKKRKLLEKLLTHISNYIQTNRHSREREEPQPPPPITTTTKPTNKRNLFQRPSTHQRKTRNNIPGTLTNIQTQGTTPRQSPRLNPDICPTRSTRRVIQFIPYTKPK